MIAAVFDLDRTLLPVTTAERLFLRYLIRQRALGVSSLVRTAAYAVRAGGRDAVQKIRADRPYLTGAHDALLRLHGLRCARDVIRPALSIRGLDYVVWHQERGHEIVLLSGSLPYVVEPLAADLGIQHVICSRMEVVGQRLTGRLAGLHPYGEAKATLMLGFGQAYDVDFDVSYCYADHQSDEELLQLFGNPVCVNPSEPLRRIAMTNGWRIETFS